MKSTDRARLTAALREHVAAIAGELRAQMRAPGGDRVRALQLHKDEAVGDDFDVWTDLLSRRAAVLWVLKSVYVRVLEDRGLLAPGRLLDPEAQQLFEKLAPNLGETAFLRWVYKDLASPNGGLPELFSVQPAELVLPSDARSRALIAFWRHRDADSGVQWSFSEERFEGELMGDLYQELDPVVKDRFALCQTPDFVREFILDRTLTPAIETFGADKVRLLDPACGSGHFLIDGLKRLVTATAGQHKSWSRAKVLEHALGRVVGMDLNDYACALARARLVMTAAELAGVNTLAEAAKFHPHVYWADGLEQVERDEVKPSLQFGLFETAEEKPRATLTRADVRAALRKVFAEKFHAIVVNPPYITENDNARKLYHREKRGKSQRYVSAYGDYSLCGPFVERVLQLLHSEGFWGVIIANNFMARDFGRPLIESVLARVDLTLVADTSGAILAVSGFETPTVVITGRNRPPVSSTIRVVRGKKGDTERSADLSKSPVWTGVVQGAGIAGFENDYVSSVDQDRNILCKHPWSLGGGLIAKLAATLEGRATSRLVDLTTDIGRTTVCGEDDVFIMTPDAAVRNRVSSLVVPLAVGEAVRDWGIRTLKSVIYPYQSLGGLPVEDSNNAVTAYFWRFRTLLRRRSVFGKTPEEKGGAWYEHLEHYAHRLRTPVSIAFPFVATHNHFALSRGGWIFNRTAPAIKLPSTATELDCYALLGVLNSSALMLWFCHTLHKVGGRSSGTKRQAEAWAQRREFAVGLVERAPIPHQQRVRIATIAQRISELSDAFRENRPVAVLEGNWTPVDLAQRLSEAKMRCQEIRNEMVALQEELDWTVYTAFGFADVGELVSLDSVEPVASEHRPFAIRIARAEKDGRTGTHWFEAMGVQPTTEVPASYNSATRATLMRRLNILEKNEDISTFESQECKRKWEPIDFDETLADAVFSWLSSRVEEAVAMRRAPASLNQIVSSVQDDPRFLAAASVCQGRKDIDLAGLISEALANGSVSLHPFHTYTSSGLAKRAVWEEAWALQGREDVGETVQSMPDLPDYSQGSRGKSTDFLRTEYWQLRGRLDVPKERFIAFTEVPGRSGAETLYGWAGWTPLQRLKALLAIDADLEDAGIPRADRMGVLDSAWRLLPDVAREDPPAAARLKAELQALVGPTGPSPESLEEWRKRFPPPKPPKKKTERARKAPKADEEDDT